MILRFKTFAEFLKQARKWLGLKSPTGKRRRRLRILLSGKRNIRRRFPTASAKRRTQKATQTRPDAASGPVASPAAPTEPARRTEPPEPESRSEPPEPARQTEPPEPASGAGTVKRRPVIHPRSDGVPDILDAIQELGGIRSPVGYKFADKGEYDGFKDAFRGEARLLIRRSGGMRPDELRESLASAGTGIGQTWRLESTSDLYDSVQAAVIERGAVKARAVKQSRSEAILERFTTGKRSGCAQGIKISDFQRGDRFNIMRRPCTVRQVNPDTFAVEIDCGEAGSHELPDGISVYPDKCVVDRTRGEDIGADWTVNPKRKAYGGGRPAQADIFGGGGEGAFTLVGEKGTDHERREREARKREQDRQESERAQLGLINPMKKKRAKKRARSRAANGGKKSMTASEKVCRCTTKAMKANPKRMTPSEQNDSIREQVEREIPTPRGGFESEDARQDHRDSQEKRFFELVRSFKNTGKRAKKNPVRVRKLPSRARYRVTSRRGRVTAFSTTKRKAVRQAKLIRAIGHGFKPSGKRAKRNPVDNVFMTRDAKGDLNCTQGVLLSLAGFKVILHQPSGAKAWSATEYSSGASLVKGLHSLESTKSAVVAIVNRVGLSGLQSKAKAIVRRYGPANE